jgi:hypothetical protein
VDNSIGTLLMAKRHPLFKQRDVARLLRAYAMAGAAEPILRINQAGDIIASPAPSNDVVESPEPSPLDQWRSEKRRGEG